MNAARLQAGLDSLESALLVRPLSEPDPAYLFKHSLLQEVVRRSMLHQERKRLDRLVGETLEQLYPEQLEENAVVLAAHFAEADDKPRTYKYSLMAGITAQRTNALVEADAHFTRALETARHAQLPLKEAYLGRGRVLELRGEYQAALENYHAMRAWGEAHADRPLILASLTAELTILSIPSPVRGHERAQQVSAEALALARELQDPAAEAKILWNLLLLNSRLSPHNEAAVAYGEQGLAIAEAHGLEEQRVYLLNDLGGIYADVGKPELAEQYNLEARVRWRETGNLPMLTDNLSYATMNHLYAGRYDDAIQTSREAYELSRTTGNRWGEGFSLAWVGAAYWEQGDIATALEVMDQACALGEYFRPTRIFTQSLLARLYNALGASAQAQALATEAQQRAVQEFPALDLFTRGSLAQIALERGETEQAQRWLHDAPDRLEDDSDPHFAFERYLTQIELLVAQDALAAALHLSSYLVQTLQARKIPQFLPAALRLQGLAYLRLGEPDRAFDALSAARVLAESQGARWSLWQILAATVEVQTRRGNLTAAAESRAHAWTLVESIAARTPPALRDSFLQTDRVRNALSEP